MEQTRPRVAVTGAAGTVGRALVANLAPSVDVIALASRKVAPLNEPNVTWVHTDGFSIRDLEVALAGCDVAVCLSKARAPGRLTQADEIDLDLLLADTMARAAPNTSVKRLVLFACGQVDARETLLRKSGLELSVLRGGGTEPARELAALALASRPEVRDLPVWAEGDARSDLPPAMDVCSVQRFARPPGWSAADVGYAYFEWLGQNVPMVAVERFENSLTVRGGGIPVLKLIQNHGRSSLDSCWFDVLDGALVKRGVIGRFEFRRLLDGDLLAVLMGYSPALPWLMYRPTQSLAHRVAMNRFGKLALRTARAYDARCMKVTELNLFPIKSLGGMSLQSTHVGSRGLENDRLFMLIDEQNRFLTQRTLPTLTQFRAHLSDLSITVEADGHGSIEVPRIPTLGNEQKQVTLWRDTLEALDCGPEVAKWFSTILKRPVSLVQFDRSVHRRLDPTYAPSAEAENGFSDAYPVLATTESSLASLNEKLPAPMPMNRFRANVVLDGDGPWSEDAWNVVQIGEVVFDAVKPCTRCVVITTDQATGRRYPEVLNTLTQAHFWKDQGAVFGMNLVPRNEGRISVGDEAKVLDVRSSERAWALEPLS